MYNNTEIGLVQTSLGPNVFGGLFSDEVNPEVTAYIDNGLFHAPHHNVKHKVAILVEPIVVTPAFYKWVEENHALFDLILTHNKGLASKGEKFKYYPVWPRIWIPQEDRKIYPKSKMTSAIFSAQNITEGHRTRHAIAKRFSGQIDLYGRGYTPVDNKAEGLADYRYQVVVENEKQGYASEKVNDCFCCGTVPIYWGNKNSNIVDYYEAEGILMFETFEELENILMNVVSEEDYKSRLTAVKNNFVKARDLTLDKMYWDHGLGEFLSKIGVSK